MKNQDTGFAEIYAQWEESHNESERIEKRALEKTESETVTVSQLKKMKVQDELDLHNVLSEEAAEQARQFVLLSYKHGLRKIRIITGKGLHSPNRQAVVRPKVIKELEGLSCISKLETNPKSCDGGSGALIIVLKNSRSKR